MIIFLLFLPFISFLILILAPNPLQKYADKLAIIAVGVSFLGAALLFFQIFNQKPLHIQIEWFRMNQSLIFKLGFYLDNLAVLMLLTVSLVSLLVHFFSVWYMRGDEKYTRYFAYLGLFTSVMLGLVLADNLLLLYIFWELVGLSSYLLIGFWNEKPAANRAAKKAFLINRIGDAGFLIGILLIYQTFHTFDLQIIQSNLAEIKTIWKLLVDISFFEYDLIGVCIFCGVIAKSAQFPLQIWLPDAMEGPTPVSALIHAATMVAAGVYLLARIFFLLTPNVLIFIALMGILTTFWGAFSALTQTDIKKILAYSTISQLGYMVFGMGIMAYEASLLHLFTHAFFKAGLFLSAGVFIHTLHLQTEQNHQHIDCQDLNNLQGIGKQMPFEFACFTIFALALSGLPFFSGFLSKDAILLASWAWSVEMTEIGMPFAYLLPFFGFLTVFLTAVYATKVWFLLYFGDFKFKELSKSFFKISLFTKTPLFVLAFLSLWLVFSFNPFSAETGWLWQGLKSQAPAFLLENSQVEIIERQHSLHLWASLLSVLCVLLGFWVAWKIYLQHQFQTEKLFSSKFLFRLSQNSFYWDKLYQNAAVPAFLRFSKANTTFDKKVIDAFVNFLGVVQVVLAYVVAWFDRAIVDGFVKLLVWLVGFFGKIFLAPQNGKVQNYIATTLIILMALLWWIYF